MKKVSVVQRRLFPVVFMLLMTLVFISITTVIYTFTKDTISLNERLQLKRAVLYAAGIPLPDDPVEIEKVFDNQVAEVKDDAGNVRYYEIRESDSSDIESYVVIRTGAGLWGEITVSVGFDKDLESFRGLEVIDQNETPGLGGRIGETWFKEQFRGKRWPLETVPEGEPTGDQQFQAITGATNTTNGIKGILNDRLSKAEQAIEAPK